MSSGGLKQKTVSGVAWSSLDSIANSGISFIVGIVLANILSPAEYGLIAITIIFVNLFNSMVDSGFSSALIRKQNATDLDYNTIFFFNLAVSLALFGGLYVLAPYIASFFKNSELVSITRVMGSIVVINALAIIQRTRLVKRVDFKTQTKISVISSVTSGVLGIGMALSGYGVWSLVAQAILKHSLNTLLLWVYNRWIPKLQFSRDSFNELFAFGWKLLVSGLIDTLWKQIYEVVIGRFYSPATLGQFGRATQFSTMLSSTLTSTIQRVSYPVLSSIHDDSARLKEAYRKVIRFTMFITFISMLGLAAIAKPMILVLIGEKWLQAVGLLQIICFSAMLYPLHAINLNMLQVQGRSDLFLRLEIIKKCVGVIPILLGIFIDIYWMLIGSVFSSFFAYYLNSYYSGKMLKYSAMDQMKDITPSFLIALVMGACVYSISFINVMPLIQLILQIVCGVIVVLTLCKVFKIEEYKELVQLLKSLLKR